MSVGARPQLGIATGEVEIVARRMGERIAETRPTRWGWRTPGVSVTFASGKQVVIQRRPAAEADGMASAIDAFAAAGIPVPPILLRTPGGSDDLIAFGHVPGEVAAVNLGGPGGAARANRMGALVAMIRAVSADGIREDPAWVGNSRLALIRFVPFSYFCICWKVSPTASAKADCDIPLARRAMRTRWPT